jgi:hypothetical protein
MREVLVPTGFAAHACRRPITLIAAWLVVLQAFLAGVAAAQAGAMLASGPIDAAAICHGAGGAGPADPAAPETAKVWHLCCASCTAAAPALAPPDDATRIPQPRQASRPITGASFIVIISRGAVRAGSSQAPPRLA